MIQEQKQLLLKDLCARLPHELWVEYEGKEWLVTGYGHGRVSLLPSIVSSIGGTCPLVEEVRLYLRPMSSMTEEENSELGELVTIYDIVDWMLAHHFDYRIDPTTGKTLIESNLAIEAPEDMYKNE